MRKNVSTLLSLISIALFCLVSCGSPARSDRNSHADRIGPKTSAPTSTTPTPPTSTDPSVAHSVTPTANANVSATEKIELLLDKTVYAVSDNITVTIHNGLGSNIYAASKSCSLVQLEQLSGSTWTIQRICVPVVPVNPVLIPAYGTKEVVLSPHFTSGMQPLRATSSSWHVGQYRVTFFYQLSSDPDTVGGASVSSAPFEIG